MPGVTNYTGVSGYAGVSEYAGVSTKAWYNSISYRLNNVLPSLIHDYANGRYYNTKDTTTGFPFTATRTTNATQFDSQGRLVWAPANMCPYSEDFTVANWAATSGTKTTGVSGPTGTSTACTFTATAGGSTAILQIVPTVVVGVNYTVSFWAKSSTLTGLAYIRSIEAVNTPISVTSTWQRFSFAATATTTNGRVGVALQNSGDTIDVWGAQLEITGPDSPKAYINTASTGSAVYMHRIDYDPNGGAPRGLLVEESRTNLCPDYLTVTPSGGSSAAGNNFFGTASKRTTFNGASSTHFIQYNAPAAAPAASTLHTVSVYVKNITGAGLVQLTASTGFVSGVNDYVNFDIVNGTVVGVGASVVDSAIINCGNGIYRLVMVFNTGAAPAVGTSCIVSAITAAGDTRLPTNTSSDVLETFGGQLEAGRGVTSLIPTFGTATTKGQDTLALTSVGWLDQTKGTWFASIVPGNGQAKSRRVFSLNDGSANNAVSMIRSTTRLGQIRSALASVADFTPTTINNAPNFVSQKMAILLNSPTKKVVLNGGTVASSSVATPTSGYTTLTVGDEAAGAAGNQIHGWIKELRYYPDASASDDQLQTLTT